VVALLGDAHQLPVKGKLLVRCPVGFDIARAIDLAEIAVDNCDIAISLPDASHTGHGVPSSRTTGIRARCALAHVLGTRAMVCFRLGGLV
jgi:hypothetical protein